MSLAHLLEEDKRYVRFIHLLDFAYKVAYSSVNAPFLLDEGKLIQRTLPEPTANGTTYIGNGATPDSRRWVHALELLTQVGAITIVFPIRCEDNFNDRVEIYAESHISDDTLDEVVKKLIGAIQPKLILPINTIPARPVLPSYSLN